MHFQKSKTLILAKTFNKNAFSKVAIKSKTLILVETFNKNALSNVVGENGFSMVAYTSKTCFASAP